MRKTGKRCVTELNRSIGFETTNRMVLEWKGLVASNVARIREVPVHVLQACLAFKFT